MRRPVGKFYITEHNLDSRKDWSALADMLAKMRFIPTRVEFLYHRGQFEYIGYSTIFDDIEEGETIPEYVMECSRDKDGNIISVHGNRI